METRTFFEIREQVLKRNFLLKSQPFTEKYVKILNKHKEKRKGTERKKRKDKETEKEEKRKYE